MVSTREHVLIQRPAVTKLSSKSKKKPLLWGKIRIEGVHVIISGFWKLCSSLIERKFPITSQKFELKSVNEISGSDATVLSLFCSEERDMTFQGSFSTNSKPGVVDSPLRHHFENDISLKFKKLNQKWVEILGSGKNEFGTFLMEGKLNIETQEITIYRNYISDTKKQGVKRRRSKKIRVTKKVKFAANFFDAEKLVGELDSFGVGEMDPLSNNPGALLGELKVVPGYKMGLDSPFENVLYENSELENTEVEIKKIADLTATELKRMDALLLKQLNAIGEFSCPSKR
eukprot:snap_masked-scaffold_9-processed-gene-1.26-mRNA-1 protein AED:1.00 eAED:1.00 QI:0/-1/0/0/-1/1/1/0/286